MRNLKIALCLALLASTVLADTMDDYEAKKRGVPIQQIQLEKAQARIVELETENTNLKKQLETAHATPVATAPAVTKILPPQAITPEMAKAIEAYRANLVTLAQQQAVRMPIPQFKNDLAARRKELGDVQKILGSWKQRGTPSPDMRGAIEVGNFGVVPYIKVEHVRDAGSAIVQLCGHPYESSNATVIGPLDARSSGGGAAEFPDADALLTGIDTTKLADGHLYYMPTLIYISHTESVGGETLPIAEYIKLP